MNVTDLRLKLTGPFLGFALCLAAGLSTAQDDDEIVVDFHTHGFNLKHLPVYGILSRFGVPAWLAGLLAAWFEGATPTILDPDDLQLAAMPTAMAGPGQPVDRAEQLRWAIRTRLAPGDPVLAGAQGDLCASASQRHDAPKELRELCRREADLDAFYLERERSGLAAGSLQSTENQRLMRWLEGSSVLENDGVAAGGMQSTEQMLKNTDVDLKAIGILVAALAEHDEDLFAEGDALAAGPGSLIGGVLGGLQLVHTLMQREDEVAEMLKGTYPDVDLFVMHMMDMSRGYSDIPPLHFPQQIEVMRQLTTQDPKLVFFGALDPLRASPRPRLAEMAIEAGALGLKYYPPTGYRPSSMEIPPAPEKGGSSAARYTQWMVRYGSLDKPALRDLWSELICPPGSDPSCWRDMPNEAFFDAMQLSYFERALDEGWTIFSHHTPAGFESADDYSHRFADPCHWGAVLTQNEALSKLRLVLAHSGGNGWYMQCEDDPGSADCPFSSEKEQRDYANYWRNAFNLCALFENVYCDFGYNSAVLSSSGQSHLQDRLQLFHDQLDQPVDQLEIDRLRSGTVDLCEYQGTAPQAFPIFDKMLYGSDFSMVVQTANHHLLRQAYANVFTGDLEQYADRFYGTNALKVLGMQDWQPAGGQVADPALVIDEREYRLVEGDLLVLSTDYEDTVAEQSDARVCSGNVELTVNVDSQGNDTIWRDPCSRRLSYRINPDGFSRNQRRELERDLARASQDWMAACPDCGIEILPADETDDWGQCRGAEFEVVNFSYPGVWAAAFFPDASPFARKLRVTDSYFDPPQRGGPSMPGEGVMRHELGHILGYRHEHIRGPAPCNWERGFWRALGDYDADSVMHYLCGGTTNFDWQLSEDDKLLHRVLYSGQREDIESCTDSG